MGGDPNQVVGRHGTVEPPKPGEKSGWLSRLARPPILLLFALALAVLLGVGWLSYRKITAITEADRQSTHTRIVIQELDRFLSAMKDAETGKRGFLITGEDKYLEPYNDSLQEIGARLESLKRLTQDNPRQQRRLAEIEPEVKKKLALMKQDIELRRTRGFDAARSAMMADDIGKATMDEIRKSAAEFEQEEERLLQGRVETKMTDLRNALLTSMAGFLVAAALLALVFFLLRNESVQRARAEEAEANSAGLALFPSENPNPVLRIATDGTILYANKAGAELLDFWGIEVGRQASGPLNQMVLEAVRSGSTFESETRCRDRVFSLGLSLIADRGYVNIYGRDVTTQVQAEEAVRRSRDELETRVQDRTRELTEANRLLSESQRVVERIADTTPDNIYIYELAGMQIVYANPRAAEFMGYSPDEARGMRPNFFEKNVHPDDRRILQESKRRLSTAHESDVVEYECRAKRADGEWRWLLVHETLFTRGPDGAPRQILGTALDITERKQAEESARQASAYNRSLLEASLDPLVTIGRDGKITDANEAAETMTGRARGALIGTDFSDYFTEPEEARAGYQQVFREGSVRDYPLELRHRDGRITSVLYNASVYRDEGGNATGVFAAARDITELKRAEESARQASAYNRSLLEASLDPLVTIGRDGKITDANEAAETMTGRARGALIGTDFSDYFTEPEKARAGYQQVFREGSVRDYPLELRHRDGRITPVLYNASVYRDGGGNVTGVFAAARDITERRRADEEIRRYTEELRRSNQELEHFAYVASHDLQEPLRAMSSFSQMLAQRYEAKLDADAHDFIGFIVQGAKRMQTLINDLLAYSRIGRRGNPFAPVNCEETVESAKDNLETAIAENGAIITNDPLPTVSGDATQLTQVFQNLFSNAIKFRRPEEAPRIHVSATREAHGWRFSVRDNGIGIDPRYSERIFIIFQRLHDSGAYPGTGIGLALCKKIVERHEGRMWVESAPGRGSTFHFTIPDEGRAHDDLRTQSSPH